MTTTTLPASRCRACGRVEFPSRDTCPACGGDVGDAALGPAATLGGFTSVLHPAPGSLVEAPYHVGVARYPEGLSVLGLLVGIDGLDDVRIGMAVETVAVELDPERLTYGFRPV